MPKRRTFLKTAGTISLAAVVPSFPFRPYVRRDFVSQRPLPENRKFTSKIIEDVIRSVKDTIHDKELAWMFENCFPNTLDTTVNYSEETGIPDTFVITGDIPAMWLRDSSAQVWPYVPYINEDSKLKNLIRGVISRQIKCILIDPYANAFYSENKMSEWVKDITDMKPMVHERKWEIDSLCYPIRLAYKYWKISGDTSCFDSKWQEAMRLTLQTFIEQQRKENRGTYSFQRVTGWQTDTLPGGGYGNPIRPIGLICSMFRPSDDATTFPFLIPSNFFAMVSLKQLAELWETVSDDQEFAKQCLALANEIEAALNNWAIHEHSKYGKVYAYEVDGFENRLFMDDANVPSLLSLPYLDAVKKADPIYMNTRNHVLSLDNPFYFSGKAGYGIGGPHAGMDKIWPLGIIMRALTSDSEEEIFKCISQLKATHAGTGFIHESFHKDDASKFTRSWFAWANTIFGELILQIQKENPALLKRDIQ